KDGYAYFRALGKRNDPIVFETAKKWCASDAPNLRAHGTRILKQLGERTIRNRDRSLKILRPLLSDSRAIVMSAAIRAIGCIDELRATGDPGLGENLSLIVASADHRSALVRWAVAATICTDHSDLAVRTLIRLSADRSANVRDWATFGLGDLCHVDT